VKRLLWVEVVLTRPVRRHPVGRQVLKPGKLPLQCTVLRAPGSGSHTFPCALGWLALSRPSSPRLAIVKVCWLNVTLIKFQELKVVLSNCGKCALQKEHSLEAKYGGIHL
jgi:hypothetical protein